MTALGAKGLARGQSTSRSTDYRTDAPHPRLFVPPRRLRLLQREKERESLRWVAFQTVMAAQARMPEPGFALGLLHLASGDRDSGRRAIEWALGPAADLKQLALVHDWCHALMTADERRRLAAKLASGIEKSAAREDVASVRTRVMAALAASGEMPEMAARTIQAVAEVWWKKRVLDPLSASQVPLQLADHLPLFELFHALRDNFDIDLRETAAKYFTTLPVYHLLLHYPAPFPAPENEYRIPLMKEHREPDLMEAARSRAAALSMVAYDTNSQEMQFLQGWLIQDRFLMRGQYGAPYEFLWANPYQPGLSFHYLPNIFHDPKTGRLVIRSKWEDDAVWFYQAGAEMQMFQDGKILDLKREGFSKPVEMGNTVLMPASAAGRFAINTEEAMHYYIFGMKPDTRYDMEVDDEEMREVETDRGGVLALKFPAKRVAWVVLREAGAFLKS